MASNLTSIGINSTANEGLTTLAQKISNAQNIVYWNDGSRVNDLQIDSGVSCTSNGEYITITTSTSGEKHVKIPVILNGNWQWEFTVATEGNVNTFACNIFPNYDNWWWAGAYPQSFAIHLNESTQSILQQFNVGSIMKLTYINGTLSLYIDNTLLKTKTVSLTNVQLGWYTNQNRIQEFKDVKITKL